MYRYVYINQAQSLETHDLGEMNIFLSEKAYFTEVPWDFGKVSRKEWKDGKSHPFWNRKDSDLGFPHCH